MGDEEKESVIKYDYSIFIIIFSLYMAITPTIFFILHHYSSIYSELLNIDSYYYSFTDAISFGFFWFLIIFFIMVYIFNTLKKYGIEKPSSISYIITILFSFFCLCALISQKMVNGYTLSYLFIMDVLIGFTTYIKFYDMYVFITLDDILTTKYLELLHDELLRYINLIVHTGLILLSAGVISSFIPQNSSYSGEGLYLLVLNHVYLVIYYLIILWLGIFAPIINMLRNIKLKIAYLQSPNV